MLRQPFRTQVTTHPTTRSRTRPAPAPDPHAPQLELHDVSLGYGELLVADAVSLSLRAGESIAVIGSNGAGKSTLLRTAAGLQPPLAGFGLHRGKPVDERQAGFRAAVATVFDDDAYFAALTVREHLEMVAQGHRVPDASAAVDHELHAFGLEASADALPLSLSSGQRRRLLLAAAFVRPAELLILDEPEQRLDQGMRGRLAERMRRHTASGTAIVFATHDADFVRTAADAVLLLDPPVRHLSPAAGADAIAAL